MTWRHPTAQDFDHRRDLLKHDWRPGDRPPLDRAGAPFGGFRGVHCEEERAEQAAYEASVAHYERLIAEDRQ